MIIDQTLLVSIGVLQLSASHGNVRFESFETNSGTMDEDMINNAIQEAKEHLAEDEEVSSNCMR